TRSPMWHRFANTVSPLGRGCVRWMYHARPAVSVWPPCEPHAPYSPHRPPRPTWCCSPTPHSLLSCPRNVHSPCRAAPRDRPLRRPLSLVVRGFERRAEKRMKLLLAEEGYRPRFRDTHPVVPNTTEVPKTPLREPGDDRVVYLGHISPARGARELIELGRMLRPHDVRLEVIGNADIEVRPMLREAAQEGALQWYGFVPNDRALRMCAGALAGLSLLHDAPNYRHSMPTKVV